MTPLDLLKKYEEALSSQKWSSVAPLMHKDVCVTFTNGTFKGINEVQAVFDKNFALIQDEKYAIDNIHWAHTSENNAVCLYEFRWEGIIEGEHCSGGGRATSVLIFSDNKWKIITEHLGPYAL